MRRIFKMWSFFVEKKKCQALLDKLENSRENTEGSSASDGSFTSASTESLRERLTATYVESLAAVGLH